MIPVRRITALLAVAAASLAPAACGSEDTGDPIRADSADELVAQLDDFQEGLDAGDCASIDARIQQLRTEIGQLDDEGVGSDVQNALADGVDHLRTLANRTCAEQEEEVETTPEPPPETTPEPPPETTPEPPPETTPEPPPDDDQEDEEEEPDEGDGGGQFNPGDGGAGPGARGAPGQLKKSDRDDS